MVLKRVHRSRLVRGCVAASALGALAVGSLGCDTVAKINFSDRQFDRVESAGFIAPAGSCDGVSNEVTTRFVLLDDDGKPLRPDDSVGTETLGTALTADANGLAFSNGALFELPDEACDEGCAQASMICDVSPGVQGDVYKRCFTETELSLRGDATFASDLEKPQLFGVVYENSGSIEGFLPADLGQYYPDSDGDGVADGSDDFTRVDARGSDRVGSNPGQRKSALSAMAINWATAANMAAADERSTLFGFWTFEGSSSADIESIVAKESATESTWTADAVLARRTRDLLDDPTGTRANVYMALKRIIADEFGKDEYADYDKTLMVLVDGPDDLRRPTETADQVIELAAEHGVRVFIVHLDPALATQTSEGVELFRDDPDYYSDIINGAPNQEPCADDTACLNFESCRTPTGYATTPGGAVTVGDPDNTYCLPARDSNGRIGPIHDYARIACETEGGYIYVTSPDALSKRMSWLPFTMDGLWQADSLVSELESGGVIPGQFYRLQGTMGLNVGGKQANYTFSQVGDPSAGNGDDAPDNRGVVFYESD